MGHGITQEDSRQQTKYQSNKSQVTKWNKDPEGVSKCPGAASWSKCRMNTSGRSINPGARGGRKDLESM